MVYKGMALCNWNWVTLISFALSVLILIVGCWKYARNKDKKSFYIGVAFGLFSLFHIITFFGIARNYKATLVLTQIFGYLIVLFTLL